MKVFIAEQVKPENHLQLINGINEFWNTVIITVEYCNKKIDHVINNVIAKIIVLKEKATGM